MASSFLLITCDVGKEDEVKNQLQQVNNIKDVLRVNGAYDLIAKVDGKNVDEVKEILEHKIRTMTQVRSAMNLPLKFYN